MAQHGQGADETRRQTENYEDSLCHWKIYTVKISDQIPQRPPISNFKETVPSDFKEIHFFSSFESRGI